MTFRRFNHLNVPEYWEKYFTKYPQGMTILESLFQWVKQVDDMVDNQNKLNSNVEGFRKELDLFISRFDGRLQEEVTRTLREWQESGFLDVVISEALEWELKEYKRVTDKRIDLLELRATDIKEFGAVGDGVTDDTAAIQAALDSSEPIYFSDGSYYFTRVDLTTSNKQLYFSKKVTLLSDDKGDTLMSGAFNITGTTGDSTNVSGSLSENTEAIPVTNASLFNKGDLISITQNDVPVTNVATHLQHYARSLAIIKSVDTSTNTIYLTHGIEHNFQASNSPRVTKVNPVENVLIAGSNTVFDKMGTTEYSSHFFANYTKNLMITGFNFISGGGKGLAIYNTYQFRVSDCERTIPTNTTAGHGYGIQANRSSYGLIERFNTYNSRHSVDVSTASLHITVRQCYGYNSPFTTHGTNSRYTRFEDCHGFGTGFIVGNFSFMSDRDVTIINCTATKSPEQGFGVHAQSYNVTITNCKSLDCLVGLMVNNNCNRVSASQMDIVGGQTGVQARGEDLKLTDITITNATMYGFLFAVGLKNATLTNISIENDSSFTQTNGFRIVDESQNIQIQGLRIRGLYNRAILLMNLARKVKIDFADIIASAVRLIDLTGIEVQEFELLNSTVRNTNESGLAIYTTTAATHLKLLNNLFESGVSVNMASNVRLISNEFRNAALNLLASSNVMAVNNYGRLIDFTIPTSNGTDIVVENNSLIKI